MTSYPKPRLIKNPTAQWEQPAKVNWQVWSAIVFAIAAVLFAATGDLVL